MATFLDATFIGKFSIIFTFLFVYVLIYGVAEFAKPFGKDKRNLNALIALGVAVMVVVSPTMVRLVNFIIPWFFIISLILFFILFALRIFSGDKVDFSSAVKDRRVYTWVIVLTIVIMIFGMGNAFGQSTLDKGGFNETPQQTQVTASGSSQVIEQTGIGNQDVSGTNVATNDFTTNMMNTIFNPKVLGLILVMLVAVFAMFFISD